MIVCLFLVSGPDPAVLRGYFCSVLRDDSWQCLGNCLGCWGSNLVCFVQGQVPYLLRKICSYDQNASKYDWLSDMHLNV